MTTPLKIILGVVAVGFLFLAGLAIALIGSYNGLVALDQGVSSSWANVETSYQRRADLIPNLVATVSGAANFEKSTLTDITEARAKVGQVTLPAGTAPTQAQLAAFQQAQAGLGGALSRLLVVAEKYPDLKASENFRDLQAQIEGTENRIAVARNNFNVVAQQYNTAIRRFPAVLYAPLLGFKERAYFAAAAGAETAPKVQFDFNSNSNPPTPVK
ncbi:LemA protein [Verrucomicrobium sp. GAS474]|uniref:LemA family protein n=1 Tax=Verrucomicrobium sp. GAS474 TaxID=1882831 RepID=UPI00087C052F|nr:LemA family protein [Verrucomicrobium sp. GAS474]SDT87152.1 LemA protein [Verrucomicrobium sp. GAS474]